MPNEIQTFELSSAPTVGTVGISNLSTDLLSGVLNAPLTGTSVQSDVDAILGSGNSTVTEITPGVEYQIEFTGVYASKDQPALSVPGQNKIFQIDPNGATSGTFGLAVNDGGSSDNLATDIPFDASVAFLQVNAFGDPGATQNLIGGVDGGPWTVEGRGGEADIDWTMPVVKDTTDTGVIVTVLRNGFAAATITTIQDGSPEEFAADWVTQSNFTASIVGRRKFAADWSTTSDVSADLTAGKSLACDWNTVSDFSADLTASSPPVVPGVLRVVAAQISTPRVLAGQVYIPGSQAGQVYIPGMQKGQVVC